MNIKSPIATLVFSSVLLFHAAAHAATIPWTENGVPWEGYYRPGLSTGTSDAYDGLPNDGSHSTPLWGSGGSGGAATLHGSDGYLNITTAAGQSKNFTQNNQWNASVAVTVEFSFRINSLVSGAQYGGSVTVGNSSLFFDFLLGVNQDGFLTAGAKQISTLDVLASDFNTIRLTMEEVNDVMTLKAYLNGSNIAFQTTSGSTNSGYNYLRFGDASTGAAVGGDMDWGAVKWKSGEAIAPVPEPAGIAMLGLGVGTLLWRRRFLRG